MPCNSDYLRASKYELELSRVAVLLDELDGVPFNKAHWEGYHPSVYGQSIDGDKLVAQLCNRLQIVDVAQYSLEMQVWWRDHQRADQERIAREIKVAHTQAEKDAALAKLTPYERTLLGM